MDSIDSIENRLISDWNLVEERLQSLEPHHKVACLYVSYKIYHGGVCDRITLFNSAIQHHGTRGQLADIRLVCTSTLVEYTYRYRV